MNSIKVISIMLGTVFTVISALVMKFTPIIAVVLVILELIGIIDYGIWNILLYSGGVFLGALGGFGISLILLMLGGANARFK